ncbi:hypothetical protein QBD00_004004 [Ochrobactrum sp. AN78]|jgi:hypothetical protein|nr:hypothetical protein [Ochrobactrum sp. AN78]
MKAIYSEPNLKSCVDLPIVNFLLAVAERWIEMDWMNATMLCATLLVVGAVFYITSLEMRNR